MDMPVALVDGVEVRVDPVEQRQLVGGGDQVEVLDLGVGQLRSRPRHTVEQGHALLDRLHAGEPRRAGALRMRAELQERVSGITLEVRASRGLGRRCNPSRRSKRLHLAQS